MNALVMYDRETDSLWSQFLGSAVQGPLAGTKLTLVPAQLVSWTGWREQHPDTRALSTRRFGFTSDPYFIYYLDGSAGIIGEAQIDDRLFRKELVVGIVGESGQKAYAYRDMSRARVINDTFEGRDLMVTLDLDSGATAVYDGRLEGVALTFDQADEPSQFTDRETGSTWDKITGTAVRGQLEGKQLEQVPFFASFWFAWTDFYPETDLYMP